MVALVDNCRTRSSTDDGENAWTLSITGGDHGVSRSNGIDERKSWAGDDEYQTAASCVTAVVARIPLLLTGSIIRRERSP